MSCASGVDGADRLADDVNSTFCSYWDAVGQDRSSGLMSSDRPWDCQHWEMGLPMGRDPFTDEVIYASVIRNGKWGSMSNR